MNSVLSLGGIMRDDVCWMRFHCGLRVVRSSYFPIDTQSVRLVAGTGAARMTVDSDWPMIEKLTWAAF